MVAEQRPEVADLGIAADERCQRLGDARAADRGDRTWNRCRRLGCGQRGVMGQDRRLQPAQLGARLEAELLTEELTALLEDPQGVGLPPGAVEREHQQSPQLLPERMGCDQLPRARRSPGGEGRAGARCSSRSSASASRNSDNRAIGPDANSSYAKSASGSPRQIASASASTFGGADERAVPAPAPALRQPAARTARCRRRPVSAPVHSRRLA